MDDSLYPHSRYFHTGTSKFFPKGFSLTLQYIRLPIDDHSLRKAFQTIYARSKGRCRDLISLLHRSRILTPEPLHSFPIQVIILERKWDHTRTKLGRMLSFDELDPDDESLAYYDDRPMDDEQAFVELTQRFLASLDDETDRDIVLFKLKGKTQSAIAETLGFSQGAIQSGLRR